MNVNSRLMETIECLMRISEHFERADQVQAWRSRLAEVARPQTESPRQVASRSGKEQP